MVKFEFSRGRVARRAVGLGFVLGVASCGTAVDFERGKRLPPGEGGGEGGIETGGSGGTGATSSGGTSSGGGSGRGGSSTTGGGSGSGSEGGRNAGGEGAMPPQPPGGQGGEGGDGASGGEGGADDGPCTFASDCTNTDPDCRMECRQVNGTTACVPVGKDADGDQHLSAACEAAPGDDCDDTKPNVYGGVDSAMEVCDGLDNDCDGKSDVEEFSFKTGVLAISNDPQPLRADIAWSEPELTWGVVYSGTTGVNYQPLNAAGEKRVAPVALTMPDTTEREVSIAWGDGSFALSYPNYDGYYGDYTDVALRLLAPDGTAQSSEIWLADELTLAGFGSESPELLALGPGRGFLATWTDRRDNAIQVFARPVSPTGELGDELRVGLGYEARSASAGQKIVWVWEATEATEENTYLATDTLEPVRPLDLGNAFLGTTRTHVVAGRDDRFSIAALAPAGKLALWEFGTDGSRLCGPAQQDAEGFVPTDSVRARDGFLVFSGKPVVQMLEVLPGCRFGRRTRLATTSADFVRVARRDNGGYAVIWGGRQKSLEARIFGANYCD